MSTRVELLARLADGAPRSGPALAGELGVSRAAVHKAVRSLREAGVAVEALPGRGYRLARKLEPLDAAAIAAGLPPGLVCGITVLESVDSTSAWLVRETATGDRHGHCCLAEVQTAGRGRRGRSWSGGAYRNLMLSLAWRFASGPATLTGLSLAVGVALVDALESVGVGGVGLKWPNDLVYGEDKLGGVLIDLSGEAYGPVTAIIGIGLNVDLEGAGSGIDQPWTDLCRVTGEAPDRNRLAAAVVASVAAACRRFDRDGLAPFADRWQALDVLYGRAVELRDGDGVRCATADGIDAAGALRVIDGQGMPGIVTAGEVSVRRRR